MSTLVVGTTLALAVAAVGVALFATVTGRYSDRVRPYAKPIAFTALAGAVLPAIIGLSAAFAIVAGVPSEAEIANYPSMAQKKARQELETARMEAAPPAMMGMWGSGALLAPALLMVVVAPKRKGWEEEAVDA